MSAADAVETIYYSLPAELREAVDEELRRSYGRLVKALATCYNDWSAALAKEKKAGRLTRLSALPGHVKALGSGVLTLFLYRVVRYIVDESGSIVGADVINLAPCVESVLGNSAVDQREAIDALVTLYSKLVNGKLVAPHQALMYTCVRGLHLCTRVALRAVIDALNKAGLLMEKGVVWVGEA